MTKYATLSPCGRYRYLLGRRWDDGMMDAKGGTVLWVMFNPSTADAETDDRTIGRCIGFSQAWGFGGLEVVNLFAFRTPYPDLLPGIDAAYGPGNAITMDEAVARADRIVIAWGASGGLSRPMKAHYAATLGALQAARDEVFCLGTTKQGHPRHPLYLPSSTELVPFSGYPQRRNARVPV